MLDPIGSTMIHHRLAIILFFASFASSWLTVGQASAQDGGLRQQVDASPEVDARLDGGTDSVSAVDAGAAEAGFSSASSSSDAGLVDADVEQARADSGNAEDTGGLSTAVDGSLDLADDDAWIFVDKSERRMVVNDGRGWREAYRVSLGPHPEGDKELEGDGRTPEGEFYICRRVKHDRFHRFLGVSYPAVADAVRGQKAGLLMPIEHRAILRAARKQVAPPWRTKLGGNIGIHGYGRRRDRAARHRRGEDWTDGCIAVTNEEIERIFRHVRLKTRVVIVR